MDAGKFEAGHEGDVMPSVPVRGAGSLSLNGQSLIVQVERTEMLELLGESPPGEEKATTRKAQELVYGWKDVLVVTLDARDPRVVLLVVRHEGQDQILRFRPALSPQPLFSNLEWMAGNMSVDYDDDEAVPEPDSNPDDVVDATLIAMWPCTGPDCDACMTLRNLQQTHTRSRLATVDA